MPKAAQTRTPIRFRSHAFRAMVLAPEPPVAEWLGGLDALLARDPAFFAGRPVILDLGTLSLEEEELKALVADLLARNIRLMGLQGGDSSLSGAGLPPRLVGGRPLPADEIVVEPPPAQPSLLVETAVRSGQSIVFPDGDVTVLGSIASGAEVVAGGSIHVYGALRGRAVAGSGGSAGARIYCRRFEPEMIGINNLFVPTDKLDERFRGRPIQARLSGGAITLSALD